MKRKNIMTLAGAVAACGILAGAVIYPGASGMVDTWFAQEAVEDQAETDQDEADLGLNAFRAVQDGEEENFSMISTVDTLESDQEEVPDFSYSNIADLAEAVMPSIVAITNKSVQEVQSFFYGHTYTRELESAGSGIILGSNETELLICTNNHVVADASELTVTFIDEESYEAQVKGTDAQNDLAVVAVNLEDISEDTMNAIKIAKIGDADAMRVGEQVVAIGNALGYGQSVTTGIISAKNRSIVIGDENGGYGYTSEDADATTYNNLIQTDAAINFGNSGGALLNMNGEVIGINSAKASASGVEGMGYAISVTQAMPILDDLMTRKTRVKLDEEDMGYIGINGQRVSSEATTFYGVPQGIYLTVIKEDGPAAKAGLQEGDILSKFDGEQLTSMQDLQYILQYYEAGETVEVTIYRPNTDRNGYEEKTMEITLGDRSELQ